MHHFQLIKMRVPLVVVVALTCLTLSVKGDSAKCSDEELRAFGDEYEQCHGRALQNLQAKTKAAAKGDEEENESYQA